MKSLRQLGIGLSVLFALLTLSVTGSAEDLSTPEGVIRALVRANAQQDLETMSALMAHDPDAIGYSVGGRQYVGWEPFAQEMAQEFDDVEKLEIPIVDLKVWTRGDIAWFAMELDYIRYVRTPEGLDRMLIPLRETGVLERRDGQWLVVSWHESKRKSAGDLKVDSGTTGIVAAFAGSRETLPATPDLSGEWLIEEEDKSYTALLDRDGNGSYSHQGGTFRAVRFADRKLLGTWHQTGNDREGGFEILFSEGGGEARGVWWYTRVGSRKNIPPRLHGGPYVWKRLNGSARATQTSRAPE